MKEHPECEDEIAVCAGIDWADTNNAYKTQAPGSTESESGWVEQTPEALTEWIARLRQRFPVGKIAIALEQSRGALVYFLQRFEFVILYLINPMALANFRTAFRVSGAKDDPNDTDHLLTMVLYHRDKLRPWLPDDEQTRKLRLMTELRRNLVDQRTALTNRITSYLKCYFPQALDWAGDLSSPMACAFLEKWPTLQAVKKVQSKTLRSFYYSHHSRSSQLIETRIQEIHQAVPITEDPAIIEPHCIMVSGLVGQLLPFNDAIQKFDIEIGKIFDAHPDHDLFAGLPGAGPVLAPRLLAAVGSNRDRYESADQIQQYSGVAPITIQSGNSCYVTRRVACPKFLLQSWIEFANHSREKCSWAEAYYSQQRGLKKRHYAAVRALAFKWIRIVFRCWKLNEPYNENTYLDSLKRRNSPLVALLKIA